MSKRKVSVFADKAFFIATRLFLVMLPINSAISVKVLILAFALSFFSSEKFSLSRFSFQAWDILVYLLVLVAGLFYTEDLAAGSRVLETSFSLLGMPFIFLRLQNRGERLRQELLFSFVLGMLMACLACLVNAGIKFHDTDNIDVFYFYQLTSIISFHPVYFAYYLIMVITIGLHLLLDDNTNLPRALLVLLISFFFFVLMLTGGQTAFVSMLLIFSFYLMKVLIGSRSVLSVIVFCMVLIMTACMFFININEGENRNSVLDDSWERYVLWESAIEATTDRIVGVGTGDYKSTLNAYYKGHGLSQFAEESYNSHNQFIQSFLTNGIVGLSVLLILVGRPLLVANRNGDVLGILIFFPFLVYGTTEVFLGRYQGVAFFAFIHQLVLCHHSLANRKSH